MLKQYQLRDYRFKLVFLLLAISVLGIFIVGSAAESLAGKQVFGLIIGILVLTVCSLIDYTYVLDFYWLIYALNMILLLVVRFAGKEVNGATRWINIGGFQFQPSELAKIFLILFFAKYISIHQDDFNKPKTLLKTVALLIPPLFLVLKQPNLSTSICIVLIFCAVVFVGGLDYKIIGGILAVSVPLAVIFLSIVVQPDQKLIHDYQRDRIMYWLKPMEYEMSGAYQQQNSITAIGSGQLFGKGLNNNTIASVKNGNFISEPQTDFIFAVAGEELGFAGCILILILLVLIVIECLWIGRNAKDVSGTIICSGMAALIAFQSFIHISVDTGLIPNTGIPLPFISYGLTSLVSLFIGMGFVLNVGLQQRKY